MLVITDLHWKSILCSTFLLFFSHFYVFLQLNLTFLTRINGAQAQGSWNRIVFQDISGSGFQIQLDSLLIDLTAIPSISPRPNTVAGAAFPKAEIGASTVEPIIFNNYPSLTWNDSTTTGSFWNNGDQTSSSIILPLFNAIQQPLNGTVSVPLSWRDTI